MDSKHYYIGFKTKSGDGTDSSAKLHLFDINGHPISDAIEVTQILHDATGDALLEGSYQFGVFPIPTPGAFKGVPEIYFLNLEMEGNDEWACEYIEVAPVPPGTLQESEGWTQDKLNDLKFTPVIRQALANGARFTFNQTFSTSKSEGPTSKQIARDGYNPETLGKPSVNDRVISSVNVTDNIFGSNDIKSNSEEVKKVRQNNVSLTQGTGGNKSDSIAVGISVGYKPPSTSGGGDASFSTTYTHSWGSWKSSQQVQELLDTTSHTYTFPSSPVPAATLRISILSVKYSVTTVSVSNGVDAPVQVELIAKQGMDDLKSENHDINIANAQNEWAPLKAYVIDQDPGQAESMNHIEAEMHRAGWM